VSRFVMLDATFTMHRKVTALDDAEFRTWMRMLATSVLVDDARVDSLVGEVKGLSTKVLVQRFVPIGLVVESEDGEHVVHDWVTYNGGSVDARVESYLRSNPTATANEVAQAIPSRRSAVLDAYRRQRENGDH
jgi:hypothetical protein